jgi:hypothetical protein
MGTSEKFADTTGLAVRVAHLPPGTSKWNQIEHRLFSFISQNWRGRPLLSFLASSLAGLSWPKAGPTDQQRQSQAGRSLTPDWA